MSSDVGVIGLGVMGVNLARNFASRGFAVSVYNMQRDAVDSFLSAYAAEGDFTGTTELAEFVASLKVPRRVLIMVPAGAATDSVIDAVLPLLAADDVLVDGGNAHFEDTRRRESAIRNTGVHFFGVGISGGEEGALKGPSMMAGGDEAGYTVIGPLLEAIAAKFDGESCCAWMGPDGAGHFVKTVHNGIEYADMQFIAETYGILRNLGGLTPREIADVFDMWNRGRLKSYLTEVAVEVLSQLDGSTNTPLIDMMDDAAGQKGTGRWTVEASLVEGSPVTTVAAAVAARALSGQTSIRGAMPQRQMQTDDVDVVRLVEDLEQALWASKVVAYAEGLSLIAAASAKYGWNIDLRRAVSVWRAGCIIRASLLEDLRQALGRQPTLPTLLADPEIAVAVDACDVAWRRVAMLAVRGGVPVPGMLSALSYRDSMSQERQSTVLVQAMRDFFGAHTYRRVDRPGNFHTLWSGNRTEVEI